MNSLGINELKARTWALLLLLLVTLFTSQCQLIELQNRVAIIEAKP